MNTSNYILRRKIQFPVSVLASWLWAPLGMSEPLNSMR